MAKMIKDAEHTAMSKVSERLRQHIDQFLIDEARDARRPKSPISHEDAIEPTAEAFLDEFCPIGGLGFDELCNICQIFPGRMGTL